MDTSLPIIKSRVQDIKKMAKKYEWEFLEYQKEIGLLSFHKIYQENHARINIYVTKMTVGTCITHPKWGKTQLFRRGVNFTLLEKIFSNPRLHTGKGYYTTL